MSNLSRVKKELELSGDKNLSDYGVEQGIYLDSNSVLRSLEVEFLKDDFKYECTCSDDESAEMAFNVLEYDNKF
jgi:hypothetical protein